ncbi:hypothetical protein TNCV_2816211 [Trichonephila clavipes]|nr:hypothetical protein TNCV_2816211 [Trichonephila clavipes]
MVTAELHYECTTLSFLIDECRTTAFFGGNIVDFVDYVRFTSLEVVLVGEEVGCTQSKTRRKHLQRCG